MVPGLVLNLHRMMARLTLGLIDSNFSSTSLAVPPDHRTATSARRLNEPHEETPQPSSAISVGAITLLFENAGTVAPVAPAVRESPAVQSRPAAEAPQ